MRWLMFLVVFVQIVNAVMARGIGPMVPFYQEAFDLSNAQAGIITSALLIAGFVTGVPNGGLVDYLGIRRSLLVGPGFSAVCLCLAAAFANSFWTLVVFILLSGVGYTMINPLTNKAVIQLFPLRIRGTAMGIKQMGVSLGGALAALTLPALALWQGWRAALLAGGILIGVTALISYRLYPRDGGPGTASRPLTWASVRTVLVNKRLIGFASTACFFLGAQVSVETYLILFLRDTGGLPVVLAGSLLGLAQITGTGGRVVWGVLSDRLFHGRRQPVLWIIASLGALTTASLPLLGKQAPAALAIPLLMLMGLAVYGWNGLQMLMFTELGGAHVAGTATGLGMALSGLGGVFFPPTFGWVVDATGSFTLAWWGLALAQTVVVLSLSFIHFERAPVAEAEQPVSTA